MPQRRVTGGNLLPDPELWYVGAPTLLGFFGVAFHLRSPRPAVLLQP